MTPRICKQPITIYPLKSYNVFAVVNRGNKHPLTALFNNHQGDWSDDLLILPYLMKVQLIIEHSVQFGHKDLDEIRETIVKIINDLPHNCQGPYQYFTDLLNKPNAIDNIGLVRAIEFLTMVSCRYVLDCISQDQGREEVQLQGLVLPSKVVKGAIRGEIWLFHSYGRKLDPLLIECFNLAAEKIRHSLQGLPMDYLEILKRKYVKYSPNRSEP